MHADCKKELEDLLQIAMDDAIEQAEKLSAAEMKSLMSSMLPGIGGLFS
jgi:DNA-binding protein YbaB